MCEISTVAVHLLPKQKTRVRFSYLAQTKHCGQARLRCQFDSGIPLMENNQTNFIQQNSSDGGFLQSEEWAKFQENTGKKTYNISAENFYCNIIEHTLPVVGKYMYVPRGPIFNLQFSISNQFSIFKDQISNLIKLARENGAGWIRIEPAKSEILEAIRSNTSSKIVKAPHDMQPKELFIIDITKPEEEILAQMKSKTRYNIKVAQKHGVKVSSIKYSVSSIESQKYLKEFIKLTGIMAKRQKIAPHPKEYYQKMCDICSCIKMYLAEYQGKVIAANLVVFFGKTSTYLHGASDDQYRNVMAPYLLQWQQILDAKAAGCEKYDFGGVKTEINKQGIVISKRGNWEGITKFKLGFSPNTKPKEFPGSYDIIISPVRYWAYRGIQKVKSLM